MPRRLHFSPGFPARPAKDFDPGEFHESLAAASALNTPHVDKRFAASLSGGCHNDKTAIGGGAALKLDETWQIGGSLAIGTEGSDVAGNTGQW